MGDKYRYCRKLCTNWATHTLNEKHIPVWRVCWLLPEQAALEGMHCGVLLPLFKSWVKILWLTSCQRWVEVMSVCPIKEPGAKLRGRLGGKKPCFAFLILGLKSTVLYWLHIRWASLVLRYLLTALVSYWTVWGRPRDLPLLSALRHQSEAGEENYCCALWGPLLPLLC